MLGLLSVEEMRQQVLSFVTGLISLSQSLCSIQGPVVDTVGVTSLLSEDSISERRKLEYVEMEEELIKKSLREVSDIAEELGSPDVLRIVADVQKSEDYSRMIQETINHFGRLDHLVNNAGISSVSLLEEATDITNFRTVMDTNFWGSAYTSRFAIPYLRRSRGKIIALSSSALWLPQPRKSIYNASKAAMVIFFETLRVELGSDVDCDTWVHRIGSYTRQIFIT